jgi:hypothetical protein
MEITEPLEKKGEVLERKGTEPITEKVLMDLIDAGKVKAVGFDMDGVLFGTHSWSTMRQIGFRTLMKVVAIAKKVFFLHFPFCAVHFGETRVSYSGSFL